VKYPKKQGQKNSEYIGQVVFGTYVTDGFVFPGKGNIVNDRLLNQKPGAGDRGKTFALKGFLKMTETIKAGDTISVDYTGKKEDGTVFDTSEGKTPLKFTVGAGMLIQGFDNAVLGMKSGESKTVEVPPEKGYGPRHEDAIVNIPREHIPEDIPLTEGIVLQLQDPQGKPVPATVAEITDEAVKMDVNHMLAGETLTFDITVRETGLEPDAHDCGDGGCGSGENGCSGC